jgi:hypothetical protein
LEAGVVATGVSGFWVQLVQGLVMSGSIVLNTTISDGRIAVLADRLRHWGVPVRSGSSRRMLPLDGAD